MNMLMKMGVIWDMDGERAHWNIWHPEKLQENWWKLPMRVRFLPDMGM